MNKYTKIRTTTTPSIHLRYTFDKPSINVRYTFDKSSISIRYTFEKRSIYIRHTFNILTSLDWTWNEGTTKPEWRRKVKSLSYEKAPLPSQVVEQKLNLNIINDKYFMSFLSLPLGKSGRGLILRTPQTLHSSARERQRGCSLSC